MGVAPNSGIVDFGTFTPPTASLDGVQGQVPAPISGQQAYVLTASGWSSSIGASVPWSGITGTPTTLAGYGITDAIPNPGDLTYMPTVGFKQPARFISLTNINLAVGGLVPVDGLTPAAGDRVLCVGQTAPAENGLYAAATGAWARTADANVSNNLAAAVVPVERGPNGGSRWATTWKRGNTLGTAAMSWFKMIDTGQAVSSTQVGVAPISPADATKFLNGATTPTYAQIKDSDLSLSNITTNNVSAASHGFCPLLPSDATKYLDGTGLYSTPVGGPGPNDVYGITANVYNLVNSTAAQKVFGDLGATGAIFLAVGVYEFDLQMYLTSLSTTSGNMGFDLIGAGTALISNPMFQILGVDVSDPRAATSCQVAIAVTTTIGAPMLPASTGNGFGPRLTGVIRVTQAGTIIPAINLQTVPPVQGFVQPGTYFKARQIGTGLTRGTWT